MEVEWGILLFVLKWVFLGLIYYVLFMVLVTVRREMRQRLQTAPPAPIAAPGHLKVLHAGTDRRMQAGAELTLFNETSLGADAANDIVLSDRFLSARHARLSWDGFQWWLTDLGSKNGTLVNGRPFPPNHAQPVAFGATLGMGDMLFELHA